MAVRTSPSIAISVGIHLALAVVVWWVKTPELDLPVPVASEDPPPIEVITVPSAEPDLTGVAVLDAAELAKLTPAKPALRPESFEDSPLPAKLPTATPKPQIASRATVPRQEVAPPAITQPTHSMFNDMRKGRDLEGRGRVTLDVGSALDRIASNVEVEPGSVVEQAPTGATVTGTVALVAPKERESLMTAEITPGGRGTYKIDDLTFKGRIRKDGSVSIKDKPNIQHQFTSWKHVKEVLRTSGPFGLLQLDFDVTDAVMRRHKADPYAARKLKVLDETRDARVAMGNEYRRDQLEHTTELVILNLEVMWASVTDPAKRREALFELWDEVFDGKSELELTAAKQARGAIIGFIRTKLPAGSANAYTQNEIASFNAKRQSKLSFAPYE